MKLYWRSDDGVRYAAEVDDDCYPEGIGINGRAPCDDRCSISAIDFEAWRYQCDGINGWMELPFKFATTDGTDMLYVHTPGTVSAVRGMQAPG